AAIEEEVEFAFMHAYAAYRYGFRADVVTSWCLMEYLFGHSADGRTNHGFSLLLEDMRLQFHDKPASIHLSRLETSQVNGERKLGRSDYCPLLAVENDKSRWRLLITSGQMGVDKDLVEDNRKYLLQKRHGANSRDPVIYKPVGGITDLWEQAGL